MHIKEANLPYSTLYSGQLYQQATVQRTAILYQQPTVQWTAILLQQPTVQWTAISTAYCTVDSVQCTVYSRLYLIAYTVHFSAFCNL